MDEYSHCKRKGQCVWSVSKIATDQIKEKWTKKTNTSDLQCRHITLHLESTTLGCNFISWKNEEQVEELCSRTPTVVPALAAAQRGGCSSPLRAFPHFLSPPAPLGPHVCGLGAGFGLTFLLPGLLCSDRHQTATAAVAEVSGHCAHMTRLIITTVRGRKKRKRIEINDLLYQERTNYSANLLLLILSHNLIH